MKTPNSVSSEPGAGQFAEPLPKKIYVGEKFSAYFIPTPEFLACDDYSRIGFRDSYNRLHWAPRRQLRNTRQHVKDYISENAQPAAAPHGVGGDQNARREKYATCSHVPRGP